MYQSSSIYRLFIICILFAFLYGCGGGSSDSNDHNSVSYTLGGMVTGMTGHLIIQNNDSEYLYISENGTFIFNSSLTTNGPYRVTVTDQPEGQTCTVANDAGTITNADIDTLIIECTNTPDNTYSIGGTITNLYGDLILQNNTTDTLWINDNGSFSFAGLMADSEDYAVTIAVQPDAQNCSINNGNGTISGDHISDISITCADPTSTYTIGGTINDLTGTLLLQNNAGHSLYIDTNGTFSFNAPYANGSIYNITVATSPIRQTCTITNGNGTINGSDISDIEISCSTLTGMERVSLDNSNDQVNGYSRYPDTNFDGQYVTFESDATDLIANDTNNKRDIFVRDRTTGQTTRISKDSAGTQSNGHSYSPSISSDGRYIAFSSDATNLVVGDTNGKRDIFRHDRNTGETIRISTVQAADQNSNGDSFAPSIAADGLAIVYSSNASDLTANDTNNKRDIFFYRFGFNKRTSVDTGGGQSDGDSFTPSISGDMRYIVFSSSATNLTVGDVNLVRDIYVHDLVLGVTAIISVDSSSNESNGASYSPSISSYGTHIVFESDATNLVANDSNNKRDIFVRNLNTGETTRISIASNGNEGNEHSMAASLNDDGRLVTFESDATNLVSGDTNGNTDIFIRERDTSTTTRLAVDSGNTQANNRLQHPAISGNFRYVVFDSIATNLTTEDTNNAYDIFIMSSGITE